MVRCTENETHLEIGGSAIQYLAHYGPISRNNLCQPLITTTRRVSWIRKRAFGGRMLYRALTSVITQPNLDSSSQAAGSEPEIDLESSYDPVR